MRVVIGVFQDSVAADNAEPARRSKR